MANTIQPSNIYAFIDSQNLNLGTSKDLYRKSKNIYSGWKLDFQKFFIYLKEKYKVSKAFLFIGYIEKNEKLYSRLKSFGYKIIFKPTLESHDGNTKGNVDAELVLHSMIQFANYDKAIIVSGDGDFYCLIEYLEENRKLDKVLIPNHNSYSSLLLRFKKFLRPLNNLRNKLILNK